MDDEQGAFHLLPRPRLGCRVEIVQRHVPCFGQHVHHVWIHPLQHGQVDLLSRGHVGELLTAHHLAQSADVHVVVTPMVVLDAQPRLGP